MNIYTRLTILLLAIFLNINSKISAQTPTPSFDKNVDWMTSIDMAKVLARRQNKMILMVWEEATKYPLPIAALDEKGNLVFIEDLFKEKELNKLLWKYFIPVRVNDNMYGDLFSKIDGKRSSRYIDAFQDDSLKIMDANGNLILVSGVVSTEFLYLDKLINKYSLNTKFLSKELDAYASNKDFFSAYYLASKYIDYSVLLNKNVRKEVLALSSIYLNEAKAMLPSIENQDKVSIEQQLSLFPLKQDLVLGKAKKVIRILNKMDQTQLKHAAQTEVDLLYYMAYSILGDEKRTAIWKSKVSSVNLKKAQFIININNK